MHEDNLNYLSSFLTEVYSENGVFSIHRYEQEAPGIMPLKSSFWNFEVWTAESTLNVNWKSRVIDREFRVISVFYLHTKLKNLHIFLLTLTQNQQKDYESIANFNFNAWFMHH